MTLVEGAQRNLAAGKPARVSSTQASSGSRPLTRLEPEHLQDLAELIACRLQHRWAGRAPDEHRRLVTARQAAEILAVDLKTVYRNAKELGGRKIGGTWRFDLDAARDDPKKSSARYASERPEPPKTPATGAGSAKGSWRDPGRTANYYQSGASPTEGEYRRSHDCTSSDRPDRMSWGRLGTGNELSEDFRRPPDLRERTDSASRCEDAGGLRVERV
jgi:hypothetical protein